MDLLPITVARTNQLLEYCREQADFPAEQPASCQGARLPAPYAYARWSRHHRRASPQGTQQAHGLSVLPPRHRMRRSEEFTDAVRGGARSGSRTVVVHLRRPTSPGDHSALVGFVVSKAVGNAVERNRVKRRLRAVMAARVDGLDGSRVVVRALPASRLATTATLAADVDAALAGAQRRSVRAGAS